MQFETLPALPGHAPFAGRGLRPRGSQSGSTFSNLNFRAAKRSFDKWARIDRLFLVQVNVSVPSDPNHRLPANGGEARAPEPGVSTANFGAN